MKRWTQRYVISWFHHAKLEPPRKEQKNITNTCFPNERSVLE
jgi:hypothetical protein